MPNVTQMTNPCQGCPAFNNSQPNGPYAKWCVAHNRSIRIALRKCREEKTKDMWIARLAQRNSKKNAA